LPRAGSLPTFEVYYGDPRNTPPEQLRTDIHIPLEPR
jgi:DNA gyrase inhibitor GyrI